MLRMEAVWGDRDLADRSQLLAVLLIGALSSLLLFASTWWLLDSRKRAKALARALEDELSESKRHSRHLFEHARDAVITMDEQGNVAAWSPGAQRIFGFEAHEIVGRPMTMIMPARMHQAHSEGLRRFLPTGMSRVVGTTMERSGLRRDGTEVPLEISLSAWKDAGRWFFMGIVRDIGERKQMESRIHRLSRLYAALSQTNDAILHIQDRELLFKSVCEIAIRNGGFKMGWIGLFEAGSTMPKAVAHGGRSAEYIDASQALDDSARAERRGEIFAAIQRGEAIIVNDIPGEDRSRASDGDRWRALLGHFGFQSVGIFPLCQNGQVIGMLSLHAEERGFFDAEHIDLIERMTSNLGFALESRGCEQRRREAKLALERSEERLQLSLQAAQAGTWEVELDNPGGGVWSAGYYRLIGRDPADFPPSQEHWLQVVHPEDRALLAEWVKQDNVDDIWSQGLEYRIVLPDGSVRWLRDMGRRFAASGNTPLRACGIIIDITAGKRMESRLRQLGQLYALLSQTNDAILHIDNREALFVSACAIAIQYGGFKMNWIGLFEAGSMMPKCVAQAGPFVPYMEESLQLDDTARAARRSEVFTAVREGDTVIINDVLAFYVSHGFDGARWQALLDRFGYRAIGLFPLRQNGEVIGVLGLHADETGFFDEERIDLIKRMTSNLGFALENLERGEARRRAELALQVSEERLQLCLQAAQAGSWEKDFISGESVWSAEFYKLIGRDAADCAASWDHWLQLLHPDDRLWAQQLLGQDNLDEIWRLGIEYRIVLPDGSLRWLRDMGRVSFGADGRPLRARGIVIDITARKRMEDEVRRLAYHDALTGLPNRVLFRDRLNQALALAKRHHHRVAVLLFDLDRFKSVNDEFGHTAGDRVLQEAARRVADHMRSSDTLSRFGGDEFVAMLPLVPPGDLDMETVAGKIRAAAATSFEVGGCGASVSASIGIAVYPDDATDAETLLRYADMAMYKAKKGGGDRYCFHNAQHSGSVSTQPDTSTSA